jgi:hypothetical protein
MLHKKGSTETKPVSAGVASKPARPMTGSGVASPIAHDAIERLAFQKWQKRGCPVGEDQKDWYDAERELKSQPVRM